MTKQITAYSWSNAPADHTTWLADRLVPAGANRPQAAAHNRQVLTNQCAALAVGGEIELPAGVFYVDQPWVVSEGPIRVIGQGYDDVHPGNESWRGTCIAVAHDNPGNILKVLGSNARGFRMSGVAFRQDMIVPTTTPWRPVVGEKMPAVMIENTFGAIIEDIFFPRVYRGLWIGGSGAGYSGRVTVGRLHGCALHRLLEMDRILDCCSIHEVHGWPFSTHASHVPSAQVTAYNEAQSAQLMLVTLGRVDGTNFGRVFGINMLCGIHMSNLSGLGCGRFVHFDNIFCDFATYGFIAQGDGSPANANVEVSIDSLYFQGEDFMQMGSGVAKAGNYPVIVRKGANVAISHFHAEDVDKHSFLLDDGPAHLRLGSWRVENGGNGVPVAFLAPGSTVHAAHWPSSVGGHVGYRVGSGNFRMPAYQDWA
jgi:hypothetical protein